GNTDVNSSTPVVDSLQKRPGMENNLLDDFSSWEEDLLLRMEEEKRYQTDLLSHYIKDFGLDAHHSSRQSKHNLPKDRLIDSKLLTLEELWKEDLTLHLDLENSYQEAVYSPNLPSPDRTDIPPPLDSAPSKRMLWSARRAAKNLFAMQHPSSPPPTNFLTSPAPATDEPSAYTLEGLCTELNTLKSEVKQLEKGMGKQKMDDRDDLHQQRFQEVFKKIESIDSRLKSTKNTVTRYKEAL
ncbi:hypothetical protein KI387_028694, partial [Taxus chinensis]